MSIEIFKLKIYFTSWRNPNIQTKKRTLKQSYETIGCFDSYVVTWPNCVDTARYHVYFSSTQKSKFLYFTSGGANIRF